MNFNNYVGIGSAHLVAERYEEAVAQYRRALQERPHARWILRNLVSSLVGAGRMEEARQEYLNRTRSIQASRQRSSATPWCFRRPFWDRMVAHLKQVGLLD
jgi:adenylate cyclase